MVSDGTVVTVGAFDGIHLGHRALIAATIDRARQLRIPAVVLTFSTHPTVVLRPDRTPALLTTPDERLEAIAPLGIDRLVLMPFTRAVADLSAREFVARVLVEHLEIAHLVIGHDHALGRDRIGDAQELRRLGDECGFGVTVVQAVTADGGPVSSTRIRQALAAGNAGAAERLLGRPYWITGEVVRGEGRGRALGVPTANLDVPPGKLLPAAGIYAVRAWGGGWPGPRGGVFHLGPRPVFGDERRSLEAHVFDHHGDLYGRRLRIELITRLRDVTGFRSVADLVDAMHGDIDEARVVLASWAPAPLVREGSAAEY